MPRSTAGMVPGETAPMALAAMGGAVRYWIDDRSRLRRLEALLAPDLPVQLDLDRGERSELSAVDGLGGRPIAPRAPSHRQVRALTELRKRNHAAGGGRYWLDRDGVVRRVELRTDRAASPISTSPPRPCRTYGDQHLR